MDKLEALKARLQASKQHQAIPLPRISAALEAQTEVIEALMEQVVEQNRIIAGMAHFLDTLGVPAERTRELGEPMDGEPLGEPMDGEPLGEPIAGKLLGAPPELARRATAFAHHNAAESVEMRPRPQSGPDLTSPSFSQTARNVAPVDVQHRGQQPAPAPTAKPPTVPPVQHVYGPGAPGSGAPVMFRPADPPIDATQSAGGAREPVVVLRPAEPEQRSDATVEFKPADPPVEAEPLDREP
jgi:hypothetical protein